MCGAIWPRRSSTQRPSEKSRTLIDLVVNAAVSLLDEPGMTLDEVINANWQADSQECKVCETPVFQNDDDGSHYTDQDHPAVPVHADAAEMVRGWLS